jgi:hypothetical protein
VASPKSGSWCVLWVWVCSWLILAPKVLQLCTNHLVLCFVQVRVSSWCLSLFLVPSRSSNTPLYPLKVLRAKECTLTLHSFIVFSLDSHLNPLRSLGVRTKDVFKAFSTQLANAILFSSQWLFLTIALSFPFLKVVLKGLKQLTSSGCRAQDVWDDNVIMFKSNHCAYSIIFTW